MRRRNLHPQAHSKWTTWTTRLVAAVSISVALVSSSSTGFAQGLQVRVRGEGKIAARASRDQGELVFSGTLTDDTGAPLAGRTVTARVIREADPNDAAVASAVRAARGCETSGDRPRRETAWSVSVRGTEERPEVLLATDEDGRFCFRAKLAPDRFVAELDFRDPKDPPLLAPAHLRLPFDLSRRALVLQFDPRPRIVSLDDEDAVFEVLAMVDDDRTPRVAPGLALALTTDGNADLGRVGTNASGRARFVVPTARLGPPGRGELLASFAGDPETAKAQVAAAIERHAKVHLRVPAAESGMEPKNPEEGIPLSVEVSSGSGAVSGGAVEAHVGDVIVGAAPVERGLARLTLTFAAQGSEASVALRYIPSAPWYEAPPDPIVKVPIRGPGLLSKAPILLAGAAVLLFFLLSRISPVRTKPEARSEPNAPGAPDGKAKLEVVRSAADGERGLRGRLVDAHEGGPIEGARVWIERGTFEGRTILASVATDARGEFELELPPKTAGDDRLGAEARTHARLLQPLPEPGVVSIALVSRRRALLARLVKWAKRRGKPFDARPEPTPGHVKRAAGEDHETAEWADAIERAAFGDTAVDARVERAIDALAPDKGGRSHDDPT